MLATARSLRTQLLHLPEAERASLAKALIDSLDKGVDPGAAAAWRAEIIRRVADARSGRTKGIPWTKVRDGIRARLRLRAS